MDDKVKKVDRVEKVFQDYLMEFEKECDAIFDKLTPEQKRLLGLDDKGIENRWRHSKWQSFLTEKVLNLIKENFRLADMINRDAEFERTD